MSAGRLDFTNDCIVGAGACEIGATFDKTLTWNIGDGLVDLSLATALMHVRAKSTSEEIAITFDSTDGSIVLGGTAGTIRLHKTPAETAELTAGLYVYDLLVTIGSEVKRLVEGKFQVVSGVTREVTGD